MQLTPLAAVNSAPFGLHIQSGDAFPHESWCRASQEALAALRRGQSVAVLGRPGTGKTFLLQRLGRTLQNEGWRVRSLPVSQVGGPDSGSDVLLVDEADRLPNETLDALRDRGGLFILAGLREIARRLADRACPVVTVTLQPLSLEDVARFVAARLSAAGHRRDLFEPDAVFALFQHSAGLLRLVIVLAGSAMFLAEHEGAERISKQHVDEAAAMRDTGDADQAIEPDLVQPSLQAPDSTVAPMLAHPEPELHSASPSRVKWVALGLCGLLLLLLPPLLALGWLLPDRRPAHALVLPRHEATLTVPPASVPVPSVVPARPSAAQLPALPSVPPPVAPAPGGLPGAAAAPSPGGSARIVPPSPPPPDGPVQAFKGPILNETMNQGGQLSLEVRRRGSTSVSVHFHAFAGLIGSGDLTGTVTADGRIVASGRLMMGRNPFDATLVARVIGDRLEGTATFTRPETGSTARSRFDLSRF